MIKIKRQEEATSEKSEKGAQGGGGVEGRSDGTLRGSGRAGAVQEEHNDSYWEDVAHRKRERRVQSSDSGMKGGGAGGEWKGASENRDGGRNSGKRSSDGSERREENK